MPRLKFKKIITPCDSALVIAISSSRVLWEIHNTDKPTSFMVTDYYGNKCWQWNSWAETKRNISLRVPATKSFKKKEA